MLNVDSDSMLFGDQREVLSCVSKTFCDRNLDPMHDVLFVGEREAQPPSMWYNNSFYPATSGDYRFLK